MESYKIVSDGNGWVLRRVRSNETVRRFGGKEEALRESLHIAHREGVSLVMNPDRRMRPVEPEPTGLDS